MVIIAIVFAILALFATPQHPTFVTQVQVVYHFFNFLIPILAVTAIINYIWKSSCCPKKGQSDDI